MFVCEGQIYSQAANRSIQFIFLITGTVVKVSI